MTHYPDTAGHRGNSDTAIAGAEHIEGDLSRLQHIVRSVIAEAKERGATSDEIATEVGWNRHRVRPRTSELRADGRIADSGKRRKNAVSGVNAIVWVLPEYVRGEA